jgi:hypothetical protein
LHVKNSGSVYIVFMEELIEKYSETRFQALTSLNFSGFRYLLSDFRPIVEEYIKHHTLHGKARVAPLKKEWKNTSLPGSATKLFFTLYCLKTNSLQETAGAFFGISQGKTSEWMALLGGVLHTSLGRCGALAESDSARLYTSLDKVDGELILIQDATVRPVERSVDSEVQKDYYDGKHKAHTEKNHIVVNTDREVIYVSPTYEGRVHDKKLLEEEGLTFPDNVILLQDTGYQGFTNAGAVFMPKKKPKGGELTEMDKFLNQAISSIRILVENVIRGIKILRMAKEKIRIKRVWLKENIFAIATGMYNLRNKLRNIKTQS